MDNRKLNKRTTPGKTALKVKNVDNYVKSINYIRDNYTFVFSPAGSYYYHKGKLLSEMQFESVLNVPLQMNQHSQDKSPDPRKNFY